MFLIIIFFMKIGIKFTRMRLIEFILPLENIEIIQNINKYKNNLINVDIRICFKDILIKT